MRSPTLEFSRPLLVDRIPRGGSIEHLTADEPEREALARRLSLPVLHALSAELRAEPWRGGGLKLEGKLTADIEQCSVVSLERFRSRLEYPILRYFLPHAEGENIDAIEQGAVDLGEVVAETLALELDPYPRKEGEEFAAGEPRLQGAEKSSPFAILSKLKGK